MGARWLAVFAGLALGACGPSQEVRRQNTVRDLRSAGFVMVPQSHYRMDPRFAGLAPNELHEVKLPSGVLFFYPDPETSRALVGGDREITLYRQAQAARRGQTLRPPRPPPTPARRPN